MSKIRKNVKPGRKFWEHWVKNWHKFINNQKYNSGLLCFSFCGSHYHFLSVVSVSDNEHIFVFINNFKQLCNFCARRRSVLYICESTSFTIVLCWPRIFVLYVASLPLFKTFAYPESCILARIGAKARWNLLSIVLCFSQPIRELYFSPNQGQDKRESPLYCSLFHSANQRAVFYPQIRAKAINVCFSMK